MTCDCISYNRPQEYQKTPSVGLHPPKWALDSGGVKDLILVDSCISDQVLELWEAGIWTESTCCGHNGQFPRSVVVGKDDAVSARNLLRSKFEHPMVVQFWTLATA